MPTSARLNDKLRSRLAAYCARHGVTQSQVIERGVELVLAQAEQTGCHLAFIAYKRLAAKARPEPRRRRRSSSSDAMRRAVRAKYPGRHSRKLR